MTSEGHVGALIDVISPASHVTGSDQWGGESGGPIKCGADTVFVVVLHPSNI